MSLFTKDIIKTAFSRHAETVSETFETLREEISRGAEILISVTKTNNSLFICGNGGSSADSQHLAAEWICRYKKERKPLKAIALTTDTSALTAIGNDYGFENIFGRQINALGEKGDVLIAITTSGQSPNILKAIRVAKEKTLKVIVLTGEKGATLKGNPAVDLCIAIPSIETARIQEMHELIYHTWCECVDTAL
ncbi:MAG: D-sedoheptulose 7-phosphate isomerase [Parcubacteria group bacterium Gr01-1014_20]|nr:MAG: D-sedoheptulose 7-phosphate isomerase [Parcubacteria group bacterium Gr01-1014_20]